MTTPNSRLKAQMERWLAKVSRLRRFRGLDLSGMFDVMDSEFTKHARVLRIRGPTRDVLWWIGVTDRVRDVHAALLERVFEFHFDRHVRSHRKELVKFEGGE